MSATIVTTTSPRKPYDTGVALFGSLGFAFLAGVHGFHRCYVGDAGLGVLQCLTCGGCWIWSIVDWINIESIVDEANRKAGWTGTTTVTTTSTTVQPQVIYTQQPQIVYTNQPQQPQVVVMQSPPPQYQQQPQVVYTNQPQQPQVVYSNQPQQGYQQPYQPQPYPQQQQPNVVVMQSPPPNQ